MKYGIRKKKALSDFFVRFPCLLLFWSSLQSIFYCSTDIVQGNYLGRHSRHAARLFNAIAAYSIDGGAISTQFQSRTPATLSIFLSATFDFLFSGGRYSMPTRARCDRSPVCVSDKGFPKQSKDAVLMPGYSKQVGGSWREQGWECMVVREGYGLYRVFGHHIWSDVVIKRLKGRPAGMLYSGPYG